MKILLINRFFGGAQVPTGRMLADLAAHLTAQGHQVAVLCSADTYVAAAPAPGAPGSGPAPEAKVLLTFGPRPLRWMLFWAQALWLPLFMRWDVCLILTDPPFLTLLAPLNRLTRGRARRVLLWSMDLYPEALVASGMAGGSGPAIKFLRWLNGLGLRALDGVIALDSAQAARLADYPGFSTALDFIAVVPPWDLRPLERPDGMDGFLDRQGLAGRKVALYAGNLGQAHEFRPFVDAARLLQERGDRDWIFLFACRGSGRADLEKESAGCSNVRVMDYLPPEETPLLLWSAAVHLISLAEAWTGVCVPSKLYGILPTGAPVLFMGSKESGTAQEIERQSTGLVLPQSSDGGRVLEALLDLERRERNPAPTMDRSGPEKIALRLVGQRERT
jgi:colanic acid biosynthesis glycosyl transferase WcaI